MSLVITWPNAAAAAVDALRSALPGRSEAFTAGASVVAHVPKDRTITSGDPLVMCRSDGDTVTTKVNQRAVVRITVWHTTEFQAIQLAGLCQGLLVAHSGTGMRSAEYVSGPVPGLDEQNGQPFATCVVAAYMRAEAV